MSCVQFIGESIGKPIIFVNENRRTNVTRPQNIGLTKQTPPLHTYGERLRFSRKAARMTQGVLARKAGMSQPTISELENDAYPSSSFTAQLADALRVSALWLAEGRGPMRISLAPERRRPSHRKHEHGNGRMLCTPTAQSWQAVRS